MSATRRLATRRVRAGLLFLVGMSAACTGVVAPSSAPMTGGTPTGSPMPTDGTPPPTGSTPAPSMPLPPTAVSGACQNDAPHPRRLLRLSDAEVLATYRALVPDLAAPTGFGGERARFDETLSVSRDTHETLNGLASTLAQKTAAAPGADLTCAVAMFGKDEACTRAYLTRLSARLFRANATADELSRLQTLAASVAQRSDGKTALEYAVRAVALSPRTLYLTEGLDLPAGADPAKPAPMSAAEMASYLSFRIAGRPPTDRLLQALRAAGTPTPASLKGILNTQFTPAELQNAAASFLSAWLNVDVIAGLSRDRTKHPAADAALFTALQGETREALSALMKAPRPLLRDVLTREQRSTVMKDASSRLLAQQPRTGVFLLPGVLAAISNVDHTDIPRRGRFLLKQLFCEGVPSPPANLVQQTPPLPAGVSERERFERIEREPACRGCHLRVNALGFSLEPFDEMGLARDRDEHGNVLRADGTLTLPGSTDMVFSGTRDLFDKATTHPVVQGCFAIQAFRHFARREERGAQDACLLRDLTSAARSSEMSLMELTIETLVRGALAPRG